MNQTSRRGAMLVMVAIVLVILLLGAVFSIDVAYMHVVRAELRTATDAAARAGAEALIRTQDPAQARAAAIAIAAQNNVAGTGLALSDSDVFFGGLQRNTTGRFAFVEGATPTTGVRVIGHRDRVSVDGPVPLFFARIFSRTEFEPTLEATGAANVRDIALVLDVSGSMAAVERGISRLDALKQAVNDFLDEVEISSPNSQVSLSVYETGASKLVDLTEDFDSVRSQVAGLVPLGLTAIGDGLLTGSNSLVSDSQARPFAFKTVVVMTDGQHNTGLSPFTALRTAIQRGQQVHAITFGAGANQVLMAQIAQATQSGLHLHADDAGDLSDAFREIARALAVTLID